FLEVLDQIGRELRMALVRDVMIGCIDRTLRRTVVYLRAAIDRDRRREVGEDLLLVLAENDRDVDLRVAICCRHLVERAAAARGTRGALVERQVLLERGFAVRFELGVRPRAV